MKTYYERLAPHYDLAYLEPGDDRSERITWLRERQRLEEVLQGLAPARVLDVGCGTGFLTVQLRGEVFGLDTSPTMLEIAGQRLGRAKVIRGDALLLPFRTHSFDRIFSAHLYGHWLEDERGRFLEEARRVAREVIIVDSPRRPGQSQDEYWEERHVPDGSSHLIYKRYFDPELLAREVGGVILFSGQCFLAVAA